MRPPVPPTSANRFHRPNGSPPVAHRAGYGTMPRGTSILTAKRWGSQCFVGTWRREGAGPCEPRETFGRGWAGSGDPRPTVERLSLRAGRSREGEPPCTRLGAGLLTPPKSQTEGLHGPTPPSCSPLELALFGAGLLTPPKRATEGLHDPTPPSCSPLELAQYHVVGERPIRQPIRSRRKPPVLTARHEPLATRIVVQIIHLLQVKQVAFNPLRVEGRLPEPPVPIATRRRSEPCAKHAGMWLQHNSLNCLPVNLRKLTSVA